METPLFEQTVKDKRFILTNQLTTTDYITTELIYRINKGVTNGMFCIKDDKYEVSDFTGCDDVVYTGFSKSFFGLKQQNKLCPVSGRQHHKCHNLYIVEQAKGFILKCFSQHCNQCFIKLGHLSDDDSYKANCHGINMKYNLDKNTII